MTSTADDGPTLQSDSPAMMVDSGLSPSSHSTRKLDGLLADVVSHSPIVVWAIDCDGRITLSEGRGLKALGLQPGEVLGQSLFEMYRDHPTIVRAVRRSLEGEEIAQRVELGHASYDSWHAPLRDRSGQITGVIGVATDITEQMLAEAAERGLADRFRRIFDASPAGIVLTRVADGLILDANEAYCQLTGYSRDELVGHTVVELGFIADQESRATLIAPLLRGERVRRPEFRLRTKSGHYRIVRYVADQIHIDHDPSFLSIVTDATQQKRYERMLRRSRKRFRTLTRLAPVGIFRASAAGVILDANSQFARLCGLAADRVIGTVCWEPLAEPSRTTLAEQWQEAAAAACSLSSEIHLTPSSVAEHWLLLQVDPELHESGRLIGYIGTVTDITSRKTAERELQRLNERLEQRVLRRTELLMRANKILEKEVYDRRKAVEDLNVADERWRSLVENAQDSILQVDPDGMIQYLNHTRTRPDLNRDDMIGRPVFEYIHPEYEGSSRDVLQQVFERGEPVVTELSTPAADGTTRWFQSITAPMKVDGRVIAATIVGRDITEQKLASDELRHLQEQLLHASRLSTIGEMTATLAHELGQPMQAVGHYIGGCLRRLRAGEPVTEELLDTLQDAVDQTSRAGEVIGRIRQFLQRQTLHPQPAELHELAGEAMQLTESTLRRSQVTSSTHFDESLRSVVVDRVQVVQVIVNLILNAIEAMEKIPADERRLTLATNQIDAHTVALSVTDSGVGLPQELGQRIFESFTTTKKQGLGIGLSVSRSIVEAHGGRIWAEAGEAGRGAVFHVRLPIAPKRNDT